MIGVFTKTIKEYKMLNATPKHLFKAIRTVDDIRGMKFDGIIELYDWYSLRSARDAYFELQRRQPELFNK